MATGIRNDVYLDRMAQIILVLIRLGGGNYLYFYKFWKNEFQYFLFTNSPLLCLTIIGYQTIDNIVAYRPVARKRQRNKQLDNCYY
jgi:hypothetical protein